MMLKDTSATVPGSLSLLPTAEERVGLGEGRIPTCRVCQEEVMQSVSKERLNYKNR